MYYRTLSIQPPAYVDPKQAIRKTSINNIIRIFHKKNNSLTIMVAVCVPCSPPPQHSPMFGHFASSQTVASFSSRNCSLILLKFEPIGIFVFNQGGKRNRSFSPFSRRNFPSYSFHSSADDWGFCTNSWKLGPLDRRSRMSSRDLLRGCCCCCWEAASAECWHRVVICNFKK